MFFLDKDNEGCLHYSGVPHTRAAKKAWKKEGFVDELQLQRFKLWAAGYAKGHVILCSSVVVFKDVWHASGSLKRPLESEERFGCF